MNASRNALDRIAAALERLSPPPAPRCDWMTSPAYVWDGSSATAITALDTVPLEKLRGIAEQKSALLVNLERLSSGAAAHDMLLWGARGMGKSALVRAAVNDVQARLPDALALVQLASGTLASFPDLIANLRGQSRAFVLFIDDLGFGPDALQDNLALRSLLDGGVISRPANVRLAVTSNRRGIVERAADEANALHQRDERDNALALADRFGLTLGFHPCDRVTYLEIVRAYAAPAGLAVDEDEALAWAIARGNRSGRSAYQFACELAGRAGAAL
ncbi:DUF815 domain-containing protein [Qipengyuania sp. ASV99]|uniref:DUF815 domain-containing protein n=1 Tax=Qipengyuania sp. ASV99 TaxID=3399681 RepID=UPI003A4C742C